MPLAERIVMDLVGRVYDAAGDPRLWPTFLEKFADAVGGLTTSIFFYDVENHDGNIAATVRIDPDSQRKYNEYYSALDCWGVHGHGLIGTGNVAVGQSLCPERILERSEFYNDFLKPLDAFHQCCGVIRKEDSVLSIIASLRPKRKRAFGNEELLLLRALMPHLQRAIQLHKKIVALQIKADSADEALNRFPTGVLIADSKGHIILLNHSARRIVDQKDGFILSRDGIATLWSEETQQLRGLILQAAKAARAATIEAGGVMTVSRPSMLRPFQVLIVPLRPNASWLGIELPAAIVFINDPEAQVEGADKVIARLFRLTPAESRLSCLLMQGKSLEEAAATLAVSQNTVRAQLQTIFDKTGTRRQGELIRLFLKSPAHLKID